MNVADIGIGFIGLFVIAVLLSLLLTASGKRKDETWIGAELRQLETATQEVEKAMSWTNYALGIVIIGGAFFTYGFSLVLLPWLLWRMRGDPKSLALDATPKLVDVIAPKAAGIRMAAGCSGLFIWLWIIFLCFAVVMYNAKP